MSIPRDGTRDPSGDTTAGQKDRRTRSRDGDGRGAPERRAPVSSETPAVDRPGADRSVPTLIRELADEGSSLARNEIALAKAEMREKLQVYQRAAGSMAVGGAFMLAALLTLLWAVNRGLTTLLAAFVSIDVAVWLSPLILTVVLAGIGLSMIGGGKRKMEEEGLQPRKTMDSLQEDKRWAQNKAREMKEEVGHG